ncbi:class I SAM-dependent methyltransferase [Agromyces aerolatus]|uniref:class I SAM-dependent methyltransferase n=1 Tax=Agromyces sp. LY-1074 TaxID=3074080 RepID=UPI002864CAFA|nr:MULTISPECIES: methyltransferase domain-containing protein [unclassified Agromyces]MDR5698607.1 methyltransferase domain-containing protein [Agromyces sp. LY-1074]MDR5704901.1 methyltransferase domain-containing protein [Agromyces sp. LY-1358]
MGEETNEPDAADGPSATPGATAVTALDAALWEPLASAALLRSQPQFDETVLDAWCRDGAAAVPTAALVGPGGRVDAIDPDELLVAVARERGADLPQLEVHIADPAEWPTDGYDLVQCVLGLASCSTPDETARHLVSLMRPGGRIVVSLWADGALRPLADLARETLAEVHTGPVERDETARGSKPGEAAEASVAVALPGTPGTLATLLHDLGLAEVRAERVDRHLDLSGDLAWELVLGAGLLPAETLAELDDDALDRLRSGIVAGVAERELTRVDASTLIAVGHRAG